MKHIKNISVLVMSCDSYKDSWQPFGILFKKYWNCPYKVYFGTETIDNEDFITIKTKGSWTSRVRQALEQIDTEYVIFLLDDFFLRSQVRQDIIDSALSQFDDDTAVFNFELNKDTRTTESSLNGFKTRQNKQMYLCSCQPSIWNRKKLINLLQKDMTPWEWETQILDSEYKFNINTSELVFDIGYYEDRKPWGIVQGKWATECIDLFKKENIDIDFTKRGFIDMKLSIITPYYKTLEETKRLAKVLEPQLTKDVEWCIIDDGCYEKELDSLKAKVIHKKNGGVSSARNVGLNKTTGEYVAFIDSDDLIVEDYVKTILDKIKGGFDYCYMSWEYFNKRTGQVIITDEPPQDNTCVWNCVYKRDAIGNRRFDEDTQYGEEIDFNLKVRVGTKANITKIMYRYNFDRENSATELYRLGELTKYKPIKAQIVMFLRFVSQIGGVETFLYEFFKKFHDKHDIIFLYEESDPYQLQRYKQYVKCREYKGEKIECETYLNVNCTKNIADNVNATSGRYLDMVHTDYSAMGWKYTKHPKTTMTVCVSEVGKRAFIEQYPDEKCEVIYNLLNLPDEPKDRTEELRKLCRHKDDQIWVSATRLSWEKGYNRMKEFAKKANKLKKHFTWFVFTNDYPDEEIPGFIFMKPTYEVNDYIKNATYYITLSNTECNSMSNGSAFGMGIPIVSTNYPSILEQGMIDGKTGYLLDMNLSNMNDVLDKMFNNIPKFKPIIKDFSKQWEKYLGEQTTSNYEFTGNPIQDCMLDRWVCVVDGVRDDNDVFHKMGEEAIFRSTERIRTLLDHNMIKRMEE